MSNFLNSRQDLNFEKKFMKFLKYISILFLILVGIYLVGPMPSSPKVVSFKDDVPTDLLVLEKQINDTEKAVKGLKNNNQARIIWADSVKKEKTKIAILYLHGFSASAEEGQPLAGNMAKKLGANLYMNRLPDHGIDIGDATMENFKAEAAILSVEKSLAIAKKLGEEVHIVGTSFGGALSLYLASKHPEIKSLVLYSPCIAIADGNAVLLDNPWGLQIARTLKGGNHNDIVPKNEHQPKYWTMHYRLEAATELQNFLTEFMKKDVFNKVNCPVYMGYYYENEEKQDKVASVKAMLEMFDELGSKIKTKDELRSPKNHVLASWVLSEDVGIVESKTTEFYKSLGLLK
ncbi:MAG: alpha/beta hydrolase [Leadbetterella sp.]